ncbi:class B sortase [Paraclostridium sordellii]|uniref:class B sortase n=1 Tax=Paraclostridium sordellii TaxID=1505 RepID=UPI001897AF17|nr:class B sortase [Paeniclostridium sordellii]MCR1850207.1 class B sortase [Paeniclostridium sordellii]
MKNIFKNFISLILILILVYSGFNIYKKTSDYKKATLTYKELRSKYSESKNLSIKSEGSKNLISINPNYKFWLKLDNTNIDYPVVQTDNNDHYLNYDFYNKPSDSGCIYMDYRDNAKSKNIILYGHNMRNKTMFNNLLQFKDKDFFDKNNKIRVFKDNKEYIYEVFSVYTTDSKYDYLITNFNNPNEFKNYINNVKNKSLFKSNIKVNSNDKIITLSTCSYEFDDARTVVHAKLLNN